MNWTPILAQCVMCYRTAAAQQSARSQVLNKGILILLVPPLLILIAILARAFFARPLLPPRAVPLQASPKLKLL